MTYRELLRDLGRVKVDQGHPVSMEVGAQIAACAQRLRRTIIPWLDEELGVAFRWSSSNVSPGFMNSEMEQAGWRKPVSDLS